MSLGAGVKLSWSKVDAVLVGTLVAMSLVRFAQLDQGMAYFEPDPYSQAQIAAQLAQSPASFTQLGFGAMFFAMWMLLWAGAIRLFVDPFIAGRFVAAAAAVVITLTLFWYGRRYFSRLAGFAMGLAFTLFPLAVFFSRYPLGDMLLAMWGVLFFVTFTRALETSNVRWAILAGLLLMLACATKITGIQFWTLPALYTLVPLHQLEFSRWREQCGEAVRCMVQTKTYALQLIPFLTIFAAGGLILVVATPVLLVAVRANPLGTATNLMQIPYAFIRTNSTANFLGNIVAYAGNLPYWLSPALVLMVILGIVGGIARWRERTTTPIVLLILILFYLVNNVVSPRYFVQALPMLAVAAGWGVALLVEFARRRITLVQQGLRAESIVIALLVVATLPASVHAYQSTLKPKWLEQVQQTIRMANLPTDSWILTSYWPDSVADYSATGLEGTWLTTDPGDANAFYSYWKHQRAGYRFTQSPLDLFVSEGGAAVIEDEYSRYMLSNPGRAAAIAYVQKNFTPVLTIEDPSPNFPYMPVGNRVRVYILPGTAR